MSDSKVIISPKTKVGELLDNFPELEQVLIQMSPAFEKLKNPVLRKTVARVATLQQIAVVGGLNVDEIVSKLRKASGQNNSITDNNEASYLSEIPPDWFDELKIILKFDATPVINSGGSPMNDILRYTNNLKPDEIYELQTPFIPAPIIDMLKNKSYKVYCIKKENCVKSYFSR